MLMVYNVVEGTMSNLLNEFFDTIVRKNVPIGILPNRLQNTIYTYYFKKIENKPKKLKEIVAYDDIALCNISYQEISRYLKLFTGNLDSRKIRDVSEKLGIDLPEQIDEPALLWVKKSRNSLAHGETNFCDSCQNLTLDEIEDVCKKVKIYLENVIQEYEKFMSNI